MIQHKREKSSGSRSPRALVQSACQSVCQSHWRPIRRGFFRQGFFRQRFCTSANLLTLSAGVVLLIGLSGCSDGGGPLSILPDWGPPTPQEAANDLFDVYDADARRKAIALIAASPFGNEEPYLRAYRLLIEDDDPTVRAACLHALSLHGEPSDVTIIIPKLNDDHQVVRWEAAKALQRLHSTAAIDPLVTTLLNDEDADVRQAAAKAVSQYRTPLVFDSLVSTLTDRNFGVVQQASDSLSTLTGQNKPTDPALWVAWAELNRTALFDGAQSYTYTPYQQPPGWFDRIQFWRDAENDLPQPQSPVGLPSDTDES